MSQRQDILFRIQAAMDGSEHQQILVSRNLLQTLHEFIRVPPPEVAAGVTLWMVKHGGEVYAAYPRKIQAEVYASGLSRADKLEIIEVTALEPQPRAEKP